MARKRTSEPTQEPLPIEISEAAEIDRTNGYVFMAEAGGDIDIERADRWLDGMNARILEEAARARLVKAARVNLPGTDRLSRRALYTTAGGSPWYIYYDAVSREGATDTLVVLRVIHAQSEEAAGGNGNREHRANTP